jgi:uncharacterized membrane protein YraQ (UPF0718 family)
VIPVISSLLIGGVPLAPVMSFWIASPSMDPEIFFLSTASIGWELSVWRLAATFGISLSAGYITHFLAVYCCINKEQLNSCSCNEITDMPQNHQNTKQHQKFDIKKLTLVDFSALVLWWQKKDHKKLLKETWEATAMVLKFMGIAFFINALITFYVPQDFLADILNGNGAISVLVATLAGIPAYTTNITALPLISGLLSLGMNQGAALAFLIAGPVTTLPAMVAVWGIASRKVFLLYLSFSILGALLSGLLFNLVN